MKKLYSLVLCCCLSIVAFGQTTVTIYATGSSGTFKTGNSTSSTRTDGNIVTTSTTQRGYAVFDLSSIPSGATATSVTLGYTQSTVTGSGTASGANIFAYPADLSTVSTVSTLFADMLAGTSLSTTSYATSTGNKTLSLSGTGLTYVSSLLGTVMSVCWTGGNTRVITITGETGATSTSTNPHAPFLTITYLSPCSGTPTAGTVSATATSGCGAFSPTLSLPGATVAAGITYQWQYSPTGTSGSWTSITGATASTFVPTVFTNTYYQCLVTCANSSVTSATGGILLTVTSPATVATLPFAEGFESSWLSVCNTSERPSVYWINNPASGNDSWRREDDLTTGGWTLPGSATYSPPGSNAGGASSSHSARWHEFEASTNTQGTLNLSVNLPVGTKQITYDFIDGSSNTTPVPQNSIQLQVSTDGGNTFTNIGSLHNGPLGWTKFTETTTASSSTAILRWLTTSDFGSFDMGLDNVTVVLLTPCAGTPAPGSTTATVTSFCASGSTKLGLSTNFAGITGITYQWFSAPDVSGSAGTYASISGATNATYTSGTLSATTWYYCAVTCSNTTLTGNSTPVQIVDNPFPNAITGIGPLCVSSTATLGETTTGGTWSSSNTAIATIGTGGTVTGVAKGSANMIYTLPTGCAVTSPVSIIAIPAIPTITPSSASVCNNSSAAITATSTVNLIQTESWENGAPSVPGTAVDGWNCIGANSSYFAQVSVGNDPPFPSAAEDGTYYLQWNSWALSSGNAGLYSPSFSMVGITGGQVSVWIYRDYASPYNSGTYLSEGFGFLMNTSPVAAGAVQMGFVPRDAQTAPTGTGIASGTPTTTTSGWYQYVFNIPATYTGATNYLIINAVSKDGDNCYLDNISITGNQAASWSPTTYLFSDAGLTTAYVAGVPASPIYVHPTGVNSVTPVTYTASVACVSANITVTVNPLPGPINGVTKVCPGTTTTLSDTATGGTWSSSSATVASVNPSTGVVTGGVVATATTATISYTLPSGCASTILVTVNPLPSAITGTANVCSGGATTALTDAGGGTWASTNTSLATVGSTGIVTGVAAGTPTIDYTLPTGCIASTSVVVNQQPSAITGPAVVCQAFTASLSNTFGGGTWVSNNSAAATVDGSGLVSGVAPGIFTITFTLPGGCFSTKAMTTNATSPITGSLSLCSGFGTTLSDAIAGGTWTSSNTSVATIGSTSGVVSGLAGGTSTIIYNFLNGCATSSTLAVTSTPVTFNVTGGGPYCAGGSGIAVGLNGSTISLNYQLFHHGVLFGGLVTGTGLAISMGLQTDTGSYTVIANPGTPCASTMAGSATVSTIPTPTVYTVGGGGNFCAGGIGFHITLSNSDFGFNYQLFNGSLPVAGALIAGTSLPISFPLQTASGTYTVMATNTTTGCTAMMSGSPVITANPLPTAFTVTGGGGYCTGGTGVHVGLSNSASGVKYQLKQGISNVGSAVAGTTGTAIDFGLQTTSGVYTVVATDTTTINSCQQNMNGSVTVTVNPLPTANTVTMTNGGLYCTGSAGPHIGLNGSSTGVNYQLLLAGVPTGLSIAGTNVALDFGSQTAGVYTIRATTSAGCTGIMTGSDTVKALLLPNAYPLTGGGIYCIGGIGVDVGLSNSDIGVNYQLFFAGTVPVGAAKPGTTTALDFGNQTLSGAYTIVGTNQITGCSITMSSTDLVALKAPPHLFNVVGGGGYCAGTTGVAVGLNGSQTGIKYQLYNSDTILGTPIAGTGVPLSFGIQTIAGGYTVVATDTITGCSANMTGSANVIINPLPNAYTVTGTGGYCPGGPGRHVGLSSSDVNVSYQLLYGLSTVGAAVTGTGTAIDFGLQVVTGVYTVSAANLTTRCVNSMTGGASVSFYSLPAVNNVTSNGIVGGSGSYCAGGAGIMVGLDGSSATSRYQLYRNTTPVGAALAGSGVSLSYGPETIAGVYTIVATDTLTSCTNNMIGNSVVSPVPLPIAYTITGGGSYCNGGLGVPMGLSGSTAGITYNLKNGASIVAIVTGTGLPFSFGRPTTPGTYIVVATDGTCSNNMSGTATITVNPLPTIDTVTGGGGYCAGTPGVGIGLNTSTTGVNYQLYNGPVIAAPLVLGTGGPISFGSLTAVGTYTVVATTAATGCTSNMAHSATVSINPLPGVFAVTGGGNYCMNGAGVNVGLSGSASGINYRLYYNNAPTGTVVPGTSLPISFGFQTGAGTYTVVAMDGSTGCSRNMSGNAVVVVNPLPAVYSVAGGGNYCPGSAGSDILLNGSDAGISYQLNNGSSVGSPVAGSGIFLDFGPHAALGTYQVIATNAITGCADTMNNSATVSLYTLPTVYTVTGGGGYCAGSAGADISLGHSDAGVNYQLYHGASQVGGSQAGTSGVLDFGSQTVAGTYTIVATDATTTCTVNMSPNAVITVNPLPTAYLVTGGGEFCPGGTGVHVGLSGSDAGISYQWFSGSTPGSSFDGTGTAIDFGLQTGTGDYTVVATNSSTGCTKTMSGTKTVTNYPAPTVYVVGGGGGYCTGGDGVAITLASSDMGTTYQLYNGFTATGSSIAGTGTTLDFGLHTAAGSYTVVATNPTTLCTSNMAGTAVVGINSLPNVYTVHGSSTSYCAGGEGVHVYIGNTSLGINYQLFMGTTAIGPPLAGTGFPLDFGGQTAVGVYTMVATDPVTGCSSNMFGSATVAVNPLPAVYAVIGGGSYCAGGAGVHVGLTGSTSTIHYQLHNGAALVGSPLSGTGAAVEFGLQTAVGSYTVIATDTVTGCSSNMDAAATVSTLPLPNAFTVTGGGSYCAGGTGVNVGLSGSDPGFTYQLYNGSVISGLPMAGTSGALNFGTHTVAGIYIVMATNTATGCMNVMSASAPVVVNPLPTVYTITGGGNYCPGGLGVNVGLSGSDAGISYQLNHAGLPTGLSAAGDNSALSFGMQTTTGAYTILATDTATRCVNNMAGSAAVALNPLPEVYTVSGGGNYCTGGTGVHVLLSGSNGGNRYILYNTAGATSDTVNGTGSPLDFGLVTGAGVYTVVAMNSGTMCTNNMTGSAAVTVSAPVVPSVTVSSGSAGDILCSGNVSTFTATPVNGGATPAYQWSVNGIPVGSSGNTFSYIPSNGDNVNVMLTSDAYCASPATANNNEVVTVLNSGTPAVSVLATPGTTVCQGTTVRFSPMTTFGGPSPTYAWVVNSAYVGTDSTYSYIPANGDVVFCILVSDYQCRLSTRVPSANVAMTIDAAIMPVVTISANPGNIIPQGQSVTLTATVANGGTEPTYQWFVNGDPVYGAVSSTYTSSNFNDRDSVACQVASSGVCSGLVGFNAVIIHIGNVGVKQVTSASGDIKLVPNPNKGVFTIKGTLGSIQDEEVSLEITDMLGQVIYKNRVTAHNGVIDEKIQLGNTIANGMYLLNLNSSTENQVFHIVIEQ